MEGNHPPTYRRCRCVIRRDIAANVNRGMRGLMTAPKVEESPLLESISDDLWVTAPKGWFMSHLRHVAIRQPPTWYFKVVSDADLMAAWLASAALKGKDILDPDAARVSLTHLTLVDLVTPPELLIIRLGVKVARNVAAPEVLLEALQHRDHLDMPTWLWDTPFSPFEDGHISYSTSALDFLSTWEHLTQDDTHSPTPTHTRAPSPSSEPKPSPGYRNLDLDPTFSNGSSRKTLRGGGGD